MQAAVWAALTNSAAVKAIVGDPARVYDKVVPNPVFPYIRIGDDQSLPTAIKCGDTWDFYVQVHCFSRDERAPRPEAKRINNAVSMAIGSDDTPLLPDGFKVEVTDPEESTTFDDGDGLTIHGLVRIRYVLSDAA